MIPLNYHHLYYFHAVAKAGSIAKARETLLLAQPTISAQLRLLEGALGRPLFERRPKRLVLTEAGRVVLDYAESIFRLGDELRDYFGDRPPEGRLRLQLGVASGTPRAFADSLLRAAFEAAPRLQASVREGGLEELSCALESHELDLLVSDAPPSPGRQTPMRLRRVAELPVRFAAAPALARRLRTLEDFARADLILPSQPSRVYDQVLELFAKLGFEPRIAAEVQDLELARRLAVDGLGVAPLNEWTLKRSQPCGALRALDIPRLGGLRESLYLAAPKRLHDNPVAAELLASFRLKAP